MGQSGRADRPRFAPAADELNIIQLFRQLTPAQQALMLAIAEQLLLVLRR